MKNIVECMLIGEIEISEFIYEVKQNPKAMEYVINIIPQEAINNRYHAVWRNISYDWACACGFNAWKGVCNICRMDDSIGDNLNIWTTLHAIYSYNHPDLPYTTKYHDMHDLYLGAIGDYYGGPEVEDIIKDIIIDSLKLKNKSQRIKNAKEQIKNAFHVVDNKKPWWIQGAEWPRGVNSPMQFIDKKRKGEAVHYTFKDVDTGEIRTVIQYY
ncbi:MAG: hypothetical protein J6M35_09225 [Clostridia bacterium]|nr:hypothetical protein [Clostridia bacterium]